MDITSALYPLYFDPAFPKIVMPEALRAASTTAILRVAHTEKILPGVVDFLQFNNIEAEIPDELAELYRINSLDKESHTEILQQLATLQLDICFLKGPSYQRYYPAGRSRFSFDLDILATSEGAFWQVADALARMNMTMASLITLGRRQNGALYGTARFERTDLDGNGNGVELMFGHFGVSPVTSLYAEDLTPDSELQADQAGRRIGMLSPNAIMLLMMAEFSTRGQFNIRDIYDAHLTLAALSKSIDFSKFRVDLRKYGLMHVVGELLEFSATLPIKVGLNALSDAISEGPPRRKTSESRLEHHIRTIPAWEHFGLPQSTVTTFILKLRSAILLRHRLNDRWSGALWLLDGVRVTRWLLRHSLRTPCALLNVTSNQSGSQTIGRYEVITTHGRSFLVSSHGVLRDEDFDKAEAELNKDVALSAATQA